MRLRVLLVVGGPRLAAGPILEAVRSAAETGWRVDVVCFRALDDDLRSAVAGTAGEIVLLPRTPPRAPVLRPRRRLSAALARRVPSSARLSALSALSTKIRRRLVPPSVPFAADVLSDIDAVRLARLCDVAVAVDRDSALAVWRLARRRPDLTVRSGLPALAQLL